MYPSDESNSYQKKDSTYYPPVSTFTSAPIPGGSPTDNHGKPTYSFDEQAAGARHTANIAAASTGGSPQGYGK